MDAQLGNHLTTVSRIAAIFGDSNATANYLSKCIYSVGMGNNDFTNNYFMPEFYPIKSPSLPRSICYSSC